MSIVEGKARHGQAIAEYGIGLALVVLLAIGALVVLSGSIQNLFGTRFGQSQVAAAPAANNPAPAPAAVAPAPAAPSDPQPAATEPPPADPTPAKTTVTAQVGYDPKTRQIMIAMDNASGAPATTGAEGMDLALKMLIQLQESNVFPPGSPEADIFGRYIAAAQDLQQRVASLQYPPSSKQNSKAYAEYYNSGINSNNYSALNISRDIYVELLPYLNSNPTPQTMAIKDYAGIISSITQYNYIAKYKTNFDPAPYVYGTNPATTPLTVEMPAPPTQTAGG